jgi:hypothetical protein
MAESGQRPGHRNPVNVAHYDRATGSATKPRQRKRPPAQSTRARAERQ